MTTNTLKPCFAARSPPTVRHGSAHSERTSTPAGKRGTRRRSLKQALSDAALLFSRSGSTGSTASARRRTGGEVDVVRVVGHVAMGSTVQTSALHSSSGASCGSISGDSASSIGIDSQHSGQQRLPVSHVVPRPAVPVETPFANAAAPRSDDPLQDHYRYRTVRMLAR